MDDIVDWAGRRPTPLTDITVWHHGGAMSRVGETETAYAGRDAPFLVTGEVSWTDPAQNDEAIAWGREFWDAMEPALDRRPVPELPRPRGGEGGARQGRLRRELRAAGRSQGRVRPVESLPHEPQHHAWGRLDRLELLERLAAALAVADRPARSRAEDVLEARLRRAAVRALERLALELDELRAAGLSGAPAGRTRTRGASRGPRA